MSSKFGVPTHFFDQPSVWEEYGELAARYHPLDLGQGFPDFPPPKHLTSTLTEVANSDNVLLQQYTRARGHPRLVKALSKFYSNFLQRQIDPWNEIMVSGGAYEALYCSIAGLVDEGDEVIVIEPYFDCYEPMIRVSKGIPRFVPLRFKSETASTAGDLYLDDVELSSAFNTKTKVIILNTPHNPTGKVFTLEELEKIANLCKKWNVVCISDEVYEMMVYDDKTHVRIAGLPGMWERTITIGSAGKNFGATGWKIGWAYGSARIMRNVCFVHEYMVGSGVTPTQEVIARVLEEEILKFGQEDSHFSSLVRNLEAKRNCMLEMFKGTNMIPLVPEGGYFIFINWAPVERQLDLSEEKDEYKDYRFTKWMIKNLRLQCIPSTAFYSVPNKKLAENYFRCCFVKTVEKLEDAGKILQFFNTK